MIITQNQRKILEEQASYYQGENSCWTDILTDMLDCFPTNTQMILDMVAWQQNEKFPRLLFRSLSVFLPYICKKYHWEAYVSSDVLGQLYHDYLEQLCEFSNVILAETFFVTGMTAEKLEQGGLISLLMKYPVWTRRIAEYTAQWGEVVDELLKRFCKDMPDEKLTKLYPVGSDAHNHGRRVYFAVTQKGKQILYKPHSLDADETWKAICDWLKCHTGIFIPYIEVENYGDYGYVPYLEYSSPEPKHYPEFFYHAGILLCVVYWLQGLDMHYENVITNGQWPYLVDLEMLVSEKESYGVSDTAMLHLPKYSQGKLIDDYGAFTNKNAKWKALPKEDSRVISAADYPDEFCNGFKDMYRLLMDSKREDAKRLITCSPRYTFRPTSYYTALIKRLSLPDVAYSGHAYYQEALRSLERIFKGEYSKICQNELEAILRMDVPIFYHCQGTRDLYNEARLVQREYFGGVPGVVLNRKFSESDLKKQVVQIRESILLP